MKILMVNKFLYPVGGCESYMFSLAKKLQEHGHEVEFFGLKNPKNIVGNKWNLYVDSYDEKKIFNPLSLVYNKKAKKLMLRILDEFKPDIVHMNNIYYHLSSSIVDACKLRKIPVFITIHDYQFVCPNHMLYRFDIDSICTECVKHKNTKYCVKHNCVKNSKLKSLLAHLEGKRLMKKRPYDNISGFICPSEFIKNKLVEGGYPKDKMITIRNFISAAKNEVVPKKKEYILYFGRLTEEKGIKLLIEALPEKAHLIIAGTGQLADYVKEQNKKNIEYVGFKSGQELRTLIEEALFSIYPSKWYENSPFSIIESISLCTPVVAANAGGNPELIDDQINGLLYKNNDANDLRSKIEYLLNNRKALEKMHNNCTKYKKVPNEEEYYQTIIKYYENSISK